jgi:hypothetical protein
MAADRLGGPQIGMAATERPIQMARNRLMKQIEVLSDAIGRLEHSINPVLQPNAAVDPATKVPATTAPIKSDFEALVDDIEYRIGMAADLIESIASRSRV